MGFKTLIKGTSLGEIQEDDEIMYALIKTGGKQYRVEEGKNIRVEKLEAQPGEEVVFDQVLAVGSDDGFKAGTPLVEGAKAVGRVLRQNKDKKIIVYKYKPKKNYRRKKGHRQPFTEVKIERIES